MNQTMFILMTILLLNSAGALAGEAVRGIPSGAANSGQPSQLPKCVSDAEIDKVHDWERANSKSRTEKYAEMRRQLSGDSDTELMARLVYAEARAANCPEHTDQLLNPIAAVVSNRVSRSGDARQTVFAYNQFASSLNFYPGSHPNDFMCPSDLALWKKVQLAVSRVKSGALLPSSAGHYYLFKNMKATPPDWTKSPPVGFAGSEALSDCFKVFSGGF